MQVNSKDMGLMLVGAAFVFVLAYMAYDKSVTGQPRYVSNTGFTTGFNVLDTAIDALDTGEHYFHPAYCVPGQTQIFTQHKYPTVSGGNITTLIHQGLDSLNVPAPQDNDWIIRPPGEVMWL